MSRSQECRTRIWAVRHSEGKGSNENNSGTNKDRVSMNAKTSRAPLAANKACGNAAAVEIHKKRGFPQAAWKSLAKSARDFSTFPQALLGVFSLKKCQIEIRT